MKNYRDSSRHQLQKAYIPPKLAYLEPKWNDVYAPSPLLYIHQWLCRNLEYGVSSNYFVSQSQMAISFCTI